MGFRFRKSVNMGPFRLNFSKSGIGYSIGSKFHRVTRSATGKIRQTFTLPGTGLSYTTRAGGASSGRAGGAASGCGKVALWVFLFPFMFLYYLFVWPFIVMTKHVNGEVCEEKQVKCAFVILSLILPPAAIFYVWRRSDWDAQKKKRHYIGLGIWAVLWLFLMFSGDGSAPETEAITPTVSIGDTESATKDFSAFDTISSTDTLVSETTTTTTETTTTTTTTTTERTTTTTTVPKVWIPASGSKYHRYSGCSGMNNPKEITLDEAERRGYTACARCH